MRRIVFLALALFVVSLIASSGRAQSTPDRPENTWVLDEAGVLTPDDIARLDAVIRQVHADQRVRLAVRTMANSGTATPHDIAVRTLNDWAAGRRSVLLLLVMEPHAIYIQPGTDLAHVLNESTAREICEHSLAPRLRNGERGAALEAGLHLIAARIAAGPETSLAGPAFGLGAAAAILLMVFAFVRVARKCSQCGKRMKRSRRTVRAPTTWSGGEGISTFVCTCGHSFTESYVIASLASSTSDTSSDSSSSSSSSDGSGGGGSSW